LNECLLADLRAGLLFGHGELLDGERLSIDYITVMVIYLKLLFLST